VHRFGDAVARTDDAAAFVRQVLSRVRDQLIDLCLRELHALAPGGRRGSGCELRMFNKRLSGVKIPLVQSALTDLGGRDYSF
jgi:hypothetical protein